MRNTHTYVVLDLSQAAFDEIATKLRAASYHHCFGMEDGRVVVDMHGLAVAAEQPKEGGPQANEKQVEADAETETEATKESG